MHRNYNMIANSVMLNQNFRLKLKQIKKPPPITRKLIKGRYSRKASIETVAI